MYGDIIVLKIMVKLSFIFPILIILRTARCDEVISYTMDNFLTEPDKINNFVMFFAPWCSHCKRTAPVWEDLSKHFNNLENRNLVIGKVDCTTETELCSNQDITGYPTLKLYKTGESEGIKFKGTRDLLSLTKFVAEELGNIGHETMFGFGDTENVLYELSDDTFDKHVAEGSHFVKFFAPWCSHCQSLAPTWLDLAENLKENKDVTIAKIDCTKSQKVCSVFDVISYPTLMWIENGKRINTYKGSRSLDELLDYVTKMLQPGDADKDEEYKTALNTEKAVIGLNDKTFQSQIENGYTFVKFYAPWCGHCKRLAPTWKELAQHFSDELKIKIAHVDCTLEENKDLCNEQEVEGYPTLFLYRNGVKLSEYNGSRVLEDLIEFLKRYTSSHDEL